MGDRKLSHELIDLGFFSALGTTEHNGPRGQEIIVKRGMANTWDINNGVLAIYDEVGRPWIGYGANILLNEGQQVRIVLQMQFTARGAHVPHSNDGGYFVREVLPTLEVRI